MDRDAYGVSVLAHLYYSYERGRKMGKTITFQELIDKIVLAVRTEAEKIDGFDHGAIWLRFYPRSEAGHNFIGRDKVLNGLYGAAFPIKEDGEMTVPADWWRVGDEEFDALRHAGQQMEACIYASEHGLGFLSSDCPNRKTSDYRKNRPGAAAFSVQQEVPEFDGDSATSVHDTPLPLLDAYVSVAGASDATNERCALAARPALGELCVSLPKSDTGLGWVVIGPEATA